MAWRFWLWAALMAGLCAFFFLRVQPALRIETDLLALLPASESEPEVTQALQRVADTLGRSTLFLVGAPTPERARAAADRLAAALRASQAFADVRLDLRGYGNALRDSVWQHRAVLLTAADRDALAAGGDAKVAEALRAAYAPGALLRPYPLASDPLGLATDVLAESAAGFGRAGLIGDAVGVTRDNRTWLLVSAQTAENPFSGAVGQRLGPALDLARTAARVDDADVEVLATGAALHAVNADRTARAEMSRFGSLSAALTLGLLTFTFLSWRPVVFSLVSMGFGALAGITACWLVFGGIHVLTLVLSSSLIGVADYSLHYFSDRFRDPQRWTAEDGLRHCAPSVLFGLATAVLGYASFALTPLPGLRQVAVFSASGLAVACGCVLCLYPPLVGPPPRVTQPFTLRFAALVSRGRARLPASAPWIVAALLALPCALGLWRLKFDDDVRLLQSPPAELVRQENQFQKLLGVKPDSRFFLIRGDDAGAVLTAEEALRARLDPLVAGGALDGYRALSRSLPSPRRQMENHAALEGAWAKGGAAVRALEGLGFTPQEIAAQQEIFAALPSQWTLEDWRAGAANTPDAGLWLGVLGGKPASVVMLSGVHDVEALARAAQNLPGVRWVDNVREVSELLSRYRQRAMQGLLLVYALIAAMLFWRYGLRTGLALVAVPAGASALTLALFGLAGAPVHLLHLLGLLLLLGVGVDYAVFLRESRSAQASAMLAVLLSAFTTAGAFGMLGFSQTPFIRALGLTLLAGITLCFTLAWLAAPPQKSDNGVSA